ncbi:LysM peptidoglycan-binding domain-containing protein [Desulforamulus aquiferis]|uniref:LysM peptidoglycan-binding domain-containing protein n=1 Tax=Desulforamulus aquiferis TaxID=1397668 RepID=A0AAW7ZCR2_9FIRM|nr:LysM peptidoglycan-binding domain-containing protein [Desulforamulus aquiferis]MDO7787121.1 LysM peptidoglycan-binding domain-containing protein [Desulforamulus aquiferis]
MQSINQFWLSFNNGAERLQLPVNPGELSVGNGSQNTTVSVSKLGEVSIIQDPTLKTFSLASEFPATPGPYCEYQDIPDPWQAVQVIERWKNSGMPVRFIVTGTSINFAVTIEDFSFKEVGGDVGTIYYELLLKEYKFIIPRQLEIAVVNGQQVFSVQAKQSRPDTKPQAKTYMVKPGDSLWKIAQLEMGNGSKWPEVAKLNGINPKYILRPGQVIKLA